ncbi:TetR/AcrR family transcriptional regulator [Streptococcus loxodontisalivarius]|uniref:AcrR family transcriptional regulator n=2 Tax=Streptococcus loxodontisalivarius TaxID=1349415 RepID=A0ABS2PRM6_9STRE|nr:TetR/AcrR family transcriptional regulator [Streptococcus loxodontisalivarius]MBM7642684.1 AcrR family transcriptional regulator [Streptococcus loxodontisalivarius]
MNNQEKQSYAKQELTSGLIRLLKDKDIHQVSVSELAKESQISRVSFYRNFDSMEDILHQETKNLMTNWYSENKVAFDEDNKGNNRNDLLLSSLFGHLAEHSDFYLVLYRQKCLHFIIPILQPLLIPQTVQSNFESYLSSFYLYGIYGWIVEWLERGMIESSEEIETWLRARIIG